MNIHRPFSHFVILLVTLAAVSTTWAAIGDGRSPSSKEEHELLAILRSDVPAAEKAVTCKLLAVNGSSASVPELARLLTDPQLASWARIALEVIPGEEADNALRSATESAQGRLLVGTINSIAVRRDAGSIDTLTALLKNDDTDVASAAAVALGRIGGAAATKTLRHALAVDSDKVRSAVAEGCVLCAERSRSEGNSAEAMEIYDEVRSADVPEQRIIEATRGAILARGQDGIPLLVELFRSPDKGRFELALGTAREFPGSEVDKALAAEMANATPQRATLIVQAMADRKETVDLIGVLNAAKNGARPVRIAAIKALGSVGDASCLPALLKIGLDADAELAQTTKATLAKLPGEDVDSQIVARITDVDGPMYPLLIEIIGRRRIDATPALLKALEHADSTVRSAALTALGETVNADDLSVLVSQVIAPKHREDIAAARQALMAASVRMPDREICAAELAEALTQTESVPTKSSLLRILGAVGGTEALEAIGSAAKSSDSELQDVSSRLLGEWMTDDAAPVLLDLSKTAPGNKYRVRALRGYIRIARQFVIPDSQRTEMCRKALAASTRPAEQKLVLEVLKRYPNKETLRLAIGAMQRPELKDDASQAVQTIAKKLRGKGVDVSKQLSEAGLDE